MWVQPARARGALPKGCKRNYVDRYDGCRDIIHRGIGPRPSLLSSLRIEMRVCPARRTAWIDAETRQKGLDGEEKEKKVENQILTCWFIEKVPSVGYRPSRVDALPVLPAWNQRVVKAERFWFGG